MASAAAIDIPRSSVILVRRVLSDRLRFMSASYPGIGFGISLRTRDGEDYLLANAHMQLPEAKADGFPTGARIAQLEGGDRFDAVCVFADVPDHLVAQTLPETKLIGDVIELIELFDTPSRLPAGRVVGDPILADALNGTEG